MRRSYSLAVFVMAALVSSTVGGQDSAGVRKRIAQTVSSIRLIDTHEHFWTEAERNAKQMNLFQLLHYVSSDMWADGLDRTGSEKVFNDPSVPLEQKWEMFNRHWPTMRNTAYSRALLRAAKDLYGVEDISAESYHALSEKIQAANRPGWYAEVLRKRAGIDISICDIGQAGAKLDPAMFRAVIRLDEFTLPADIIPVVEKRDKVTITSLADWEAALDQAFVRAKEAGFVAIKSGLAYNRSLNYRDVNQTEAEACFKSLVARRGTISRDEWRRESLPLQDYMFGRIAANCAKYNLPLQIHTGLFYDTWRDVTQSNPSLLTPLIIRNPKTRFVLMHGGYPYGTELLAMAKNLPNVVLDMCWVYVISPSYAYRFINEAIETVPADKLLGFGGDYQVPEGAYGHAVMCRETVSRVLADKVIEGYWTEEEAVKYARLILRENAIRVFGLPLS
ncbi:MAG: amidohydrolase [Acidobacteria bacterium]|nr:MAG: amidohydrolase [Acidobacteriota bacterium]